MVPCQVLTRGAETSDFNPYYFSLFTCSSLSSTRCISLYSCPVYGLHCLQTTIRSYGIHHFQIALWPLPIPPFPSPHSPFPFPLPACLPACLLACLPPTAHHAIPRRHRLSLCRIGPPFIIFPALRLSPSAHRASSVHRPSSIALHPSFTSHRPTLKPAHTQPPTPRTTKPPNHQTTKTLATGFSHSPHILSYTTTHLKVHCICNPILPPTPSNSRPEH
ncbi:hypothetical protein F4861DRAFT_119167 [Xylaria intraflava]|nr:hypothetical protein F4861DRAFT_119167 [Xylaria intraflava]